MASISRSSPDEDSRLSLGAPVKLGKLRAKLVCRLLLLLLVVVVVWLFVVEV